METLDQELSKLKARAKRLELEIDIETDRDEKLAKRAELTALRADITALRNQIMEQSRGNFFFFVANFIFALNLYISCDPA